MWVGVLVTAGLAQQARLFFLPATAPVPQGTAVPTAFLHCSESIKRYFWYQVRSFHLSFFGSEN